MASSASAIGKGGNADEGLAALVAVLGMHHIAASSAQLRHELGHSDAASAVELVRLARAHDGVRARTIETGFDRLSRLPRPALGEAVDGWFVIGRVVGDMVTVIRPGSPPRQLDRAAFEGNWTGKIVLVTMREGIVASAARFDIGWFVPQLVRYRRLIGEVLAISLALNLLGLAAPLIFQNVIDKVLVHNTLATLQVLAVAIVAVALWEVALGWLRTRLYSETSQKLDVELGVRLFRHLMRLPLAYFEARRVGDTVTRVRQLESIREFLTNASLSVFVDPPFAIVFLIAMWLYSPTLLGVFALTIPAYVLVPLLVTKSLRRRLDEKFERSAANNALLVESISGIQTIKAAAVEPQWRERWERQLAAYSNAGQRVINLASTSTQMVQLISKLGLAAILFFGAREVISGTLTVGGLVAFNMFAQRVSAPILRLAQLWQDFQQVRLSVERLGDVLNAPPEPGAASRTTLPKLRGEVRFERVRFRYAPETPWVLEDIDFSLPAGESIGIVGTSGSGKSTLGKLVQRLYLPDAGRILIDGVDIAQIDPAWLRRQIGVVLQENLLFNRSIRDNIALANPAMPFEHVMTAAQLAGAHDFILAMPHGYDTAIEERGANLSGGQRQRIAIARALVTQPRILIFDEATSALDVESEEIIRVNLKAIARGRTVIIIAHRLSALSHCDRIMTLDRGRIVEIGTHEALLREGGRYAAFHRRQIDLGRARTK